ncbi:serine/threonine protein kinase [Gigaspora margarita]|uniref:Serine/threonine protein kinase n=1 Tax=Gigaspora margarita TaxID=4874 RepID=A0A8H4A828_GIGMA|nr:serine/threonine protein kinase [Gigaspora margarita]
MDDIQLPLEIIKGKRPEIINGTPPDYVDLMTKCWDKDPDKRPEAGKIMKKMEDMLRDIYANDNFQKLIKLIPVNIKTTSKWKICVNRKKRPYTEIINKTLEDLLKDAYTNYRELNVHSYSSGRHKGWNTLRKFRIRKMNPSIKSRGIPVNELSLLLENERIINDTSSITEQDESIITGHAYSPSTVFEHHRKTTAISMSSLSLLEQDGCNITEECSLLSKQSENTTIDDALILRQSMYSLRDQDNVPIVQTDTSIQLKMKRDSANLTTKLFFIIN